MRYRDSAGPVALARGDQFGARRRIRRARWNPTKACSRSLPHPVPVMSIRRRSTGGIAGSAGEIDGTTNPAQDNHGNPRARREQRRGHRRLNPHVPTTERRRRTQPDGKLHISGTERRG
ncbi:hypothetical protein GCM10009764_11370 [Nocardia ninae]|uniref:Uncharacterized protein n=1 Tax=Nocardia ninae NBRC 108245 TaxID=1210091 RepID=A0A511MN93_9NOCA|nr:hypothetical protein NN4_65910 [Nocardia ninae NBRC 108245]